MSKLVAALREKFPTRQKLLEALGVDEALLADEIARSRKLAHDSKENVMTTPAPTRIAYLALTRTATAVNPLLAMDAKVDYAPIFKGLTRKTFDAKKLTEAVRQAVKGKTIAKDADLGMGHVASMLNHIEGAAAKEESLDESVSEPQHKAMEAAAHGHSNIGIPKDVGKEFAEADKGKTFDDAGVGEFLRGKGVDEETIKSAVDMMFKKSVGGGADPEKESETDEQRKAKAEEAELNKERADDAAKAKDEAEEAKRKAEDAMKGMVSKDEMNAAVKAAVVANDAKNRGIQEAREYVRPWVGDLPIAMDSATDVLRKTAKMIGIDEADKINDEGLRALIKRHPKIGAKPPQQANDELALDEAARDKLAKKFPGIDQIGVYN